MTETRLPMTRKKRLDIIRASAAEFRDFGYAGARVDRIAERANVSKRTLYKHFVSKDALFDAIMASVVLPMARQDVPKLDSKKPIKPQMTSLAKAYMAIVSSDDYVGLARVIVSEFIRDPERSQAAKIKADVATGPIEDMIGQAMAAGLLRQHDPGYAAEQLSGMLKAFFYWPKFLSGVPSLDDLQAEHIIDDCLEMFLAHYKA
ncbi:TetR/AcrR family transcriptional regulator [Agrobacterium tumefaciens]|uniref:TetR/AcrR family transcriptional regulator n=1 Tax=Agrobacterium tumefaciens TaxID=358 RepID=UPI001571A636|nr:TetR/AcrR family transcriptional regulator [Agrobacterium tumefaciens]